MRAALSRRVNKGSVSLMEVLDATLKHHVLLALLNTGCYTAGGRDGGLQRAGSKYSDTLAKILQQGFPRKRTEQCCYVTVEPSGTPMVLVLLRVRGAPLCVLVDRRGACPRMYLLSCKLTDEELFHGTVLDVCLLHDTDVLSLRDVSLFKGVNVCRRPVSQRLHQLQTMLTQHYDYNPLLDAARLTLSKWVEVPATDALLKAVKQQQDEADDCGSKQLFVATPDGRTWRTPLSQGKMLEGSSTASAINK